MKEKIIARIVQKLTSARYVIAILLTITFMVLAFNGKLTTEFTIIYTAVTVFYFTKDRKDNTAIENKKEQKKKENKLKT